MRPCRCVHGFIPGDPQFGGWGLLSQRFFLAGRASRLCLPKAPGSLSGNWPTGAIIPALANAPELGLLRAFPAPVLLPPAVPPFAGLALAPPSAAPRLPNGLTADGSGYSVNLGSANAWRIGGRPVDAR